ncbi:MAG: GIN domain-containing protein [Kiloniellaceae bacterium]
MRFAHRYALLFAGLLLSPGAALADTAIGPKTYAAQAVRIDHLVGTLRVEVRPDGPLEVVLQGDKDMVEDISVRVEGDTLLIERERSLLDWPPEDLFKWRDRYPIVTLRVPPGTPFDIDTMIGRATVGDLNAELRLGTGALDAEIGDVTDAKVRLSGMGDIRIGRVRGNLQVEIAGSGNLDVKAAEAAEITVSGSGDVTLGPVARGLTFKISGSGNVDVAEVHGPVEGWINSSGRVSVRGGAADPLRLRINGSGDFTLDGEAVEPDLSVNGSGKIRLGAYRGTIRLRTFTGTLTPQPGGGLLVAE